MLQLTVNTDATLEEVHLTGKKTNCSGRALNCDLFETETELGNVDIHSSNDLDISA